MSQPHWKSQRAVLIVAHPGHELRVHHWLELAKPTVLVLTDGSGRTAKSRLDSTTKILEQVGAKPGGVYGKFTDAQIYQMMLEGKQDVFLGLLKDIAAVLDSVKADYVVGDALEGYNTSHEICRYLVGAACELVRCRSGREIRNYDFLLTGRPDECPAGLQADAICLKLDDAAINRKLAAAEGYPELKHEVEFALKEFGRAAFATEWLRPAENRIGLEATAEKPYYETYGEKQKAAGHYQHVIRQEEHMLPVAQALWSHAAAQRS